MTSVLIVCNCFLLTPYKNELPFGVPTKEVFPERHLNPKNVIAFSVYVPNKCVIPSLALMSGKSLFEEDSSKTLKLISKLM